MTASSLDGVLEQLCSGDPAAAEQVFLAYEPYLRKVVRRLLPPRLRTKLDSQDIVQSVWADLLSGFRDAGWRFASAGQLQTFLVTAVRNRVIDRCRTYASALEREQLLTGSALKRLPDAAQRPEEVAQAEELWERMLALCPPQHRPLLLLRRQGLDVPEIAGRIGLHVDSVRRILRTLARRTASNELPPRPGP